MASDAEVEAGAEVMASLCTVGIIEAPQLPAPCWNGSVRAILDAAEKVREPVVFVTADYFPGPQLRCTVNGPQHVIVELVK